MPGVNVGRHDQHLYAKPSAVKVKSRTQRITMNPTTRSVSIISAGPQGPAGAAGDGSLSYIYVQGAPASSWVINHNLNFYPNVTVEEEGTGRMIMCSEIYHSVNQIELQFNTPRAGTARLS